MRVLLAFAIGALIAHANAAVEFLAFSERIPTFPYFGAPILLAFVYFASREVQPRWFLLRELPISYLALLTIVPIVVGGLLDKWDTAHRDVGEVVDGISVADAHEHPEATSFVFLDAELRMDLMGHTDVDIPDDESVFVAVPIVQRHWKRSEPVPAWAVLSVSKMREVVGDETGARVGDLRRPLGMGSVRYRSDGYAAAIEDAKSRHGLAEVGGAPLVKWSDPFSVESHRQSLALTGLAVMNGLWLARILLFALGRRAPPDAEASPPDPEA